MTDGQKRKVWFEWSASAYLSSSSFLYLPTPMTSAQSGSVGRRTSADALSHRSPSPWSGPRGSNPPFSPMVDAFASAPSPYPGQHSGNGRDRDSGRMQGIEEELESGLSGERRIKIGMSRLHNPQGKVSSLGLG